MRKTSRAIVIKNNKILLIERYNKGVHYFVLPGGHVEEGESSEATVLREVLEETSIKVEPLSMIRSEIDGLGNEQYIYLCRFVSGEPMLPLNCPEAKKAATSNDKWMPAWFDLNDLRDQVVYPKDLAKIVASV
ncbi:MAG: NUDIX domain-containing protein [Candidatus Woesebacteria bacterium]|jgi:ADP-ribose pyrophosphatase YjhB (NUDIX family)